MILDIKSLAADIRQDIKDTITKNNLTPHLSVILVGENPASISYVSAKERAAKEVGIQAKTLIFPQSISQKELLEVIEKENNNSETHGILVQFPLPDHIEKSAVIRTIATHKDVDGFTAESIEKTYLLREDGAWFYPCTPKGIVRIIKKFRPDIAGKEVVIIGNGNLVGKPLSLMLGNLEATVTVCQKATADLKKHTLGADIIVAAAGVPWLVKKDMVRPGALVIDVGITRTENGLRGDCLTEEIAEIADITPVPGGVGPMTVAMLMENVLEASRR